MKHAGSLPWLRALRLTGPVLVALLAPGSNTVVSAHDIPNDVTIHTFVRPEGRRLHVLVRVPLVAMRDLDYPRRGASTLGLLDLARADATLRDAATLWIADFLDMYENDEKLPSPQVAAVRASLQSDQSFRSYEEAIAHVTGPPLPPDTEFVWSQGLLDVMFDYPIQSDASRFAVAPRFARLGNRTVTVLQFVPPGGAVRAFELEGDPGIVRLDPRWHQAALRFVALGFEHILDGTDHLLFLFCLVIPFRRIRSLVAIVTSFTIAHSITLIASAYGVAPDALWFPPLIETLIAVSIVYMAIENIINAVPEDAGRAFQARHDEASGAFQARRDAVLRHRWLITFAFGLVHGFGFSFALRRTLQFAGSHLITSLLSFNVGVELGQLLVLVLLIPALDLLFRFVVKEWLGTIVLSTLVGHTAWHWTADRWSVLRQYRFGWPALDLAFWATAMRWAMLAVALYAVYWAIGLITARSQPPREPETLSIRE